MLDFVYLFMNDLWSIMVQSFIIEKYENTYYTKPRLGWTTNSNYKDMKASGE